MEHLTHKRLWLQYLSSISLWYLLLHSDPLPLSNASANKGSRRGDIKIERPRQKNVFIRHRMSLQYELPSEFSNRFSLRMDNLSDNDHSALFCISTRDRPKIPQRMFANLLLHPHGMVWL